MSEIHELVLHHGVERARELARSKQDRRLVEIAREKEILVVEDNPYGLLRFEGEPLPTLYSLDGGNYVVYLGTFSKILSAGLRIGWVREHFGPGLNAEVESAVRAALDVYESLGASLHEVSLPHSKYAVATYYVIAPSEASSNLARYDGVHYGYRTDEKEMLAELAADRKRLDAAGNGAGLESLDSALVRMYRRTRAEGFGAEVKRRILLGTYALSAGYYDAYYLKAQQVRRLLAEEFLRAFAGVDVIVTPTSPIPAFKLGEKTGDPLAMYLADIYTVTASLAGICGVTVPCGKTAAGLPVGMQVLAAHLNEATAFRAARAVEAAGI